MRVTMIGSGYVGLVTGACFAEFGFDVMCVDKDQKKIDSLKKGIIPIYEPGLESLIHQGVKNAHLSFSTDLSSAVHDATVFMIAVGTPSRRGDGHADLTYVYDAVIEIAHALNRYTVIVTKSTVPVGTSQEISRIIKETRPDLTEGVDFDIASNPEFLREGSAINDFMRPDRVVVGSDSKRAQDVMQRLYRPLYLIETPIIFTNRPTAELIKYASNGFLALKIGFINQMADVCEHVGADIQELAKGMGLDNRINRKFLNVSPGYGGSCFPKDTLALSRTAHDVGVPCTIIDAVITANDHRKREMAHRIINRLKKRSLSNPRVAIFGITFKPNTDDMRDAASLSIIPELHSAGIEVVIYDPLYHKHSERLPHLKQQGIDWPYVTWAKGVYDALSHHIDAVIMLTEWNEFRGIDLDHLAKNIKTQPPHKPLLFDFRNMYKPYETHAFQYISLGRPEQNTALNTQ
jgi:UDPglucose 6-dehydrogenase